VYILISCYVRHYRHHLLVLCQTKQNGL